MTIGPGKQVRHLTVKLGPPTPALFLGRFVEISYANLGHFLVQTRRVPYTVTFQQAPHFNRLHMPGNH